MHKPLELPFRVRVWHFVRGLLFYNTVYWKRASDGLNPPRLSRQERQLHQPTRDLAIIRPREKPRASTLPTPDVQVSIPSIAPLPTVAPPEATPDEGIAVPLPAAQEPAQPELPPGTPSPEVVVKRRKYRRRHNKVSAFPSAAMGANKKGLLGRLFKR